jgi:hypothetical protein
MKLVVEAWERLRADAFARATRAAVTEGIDGAEQVPPAVAPSLWTEAMEPGIRAGAYAMYRALLVTMPWVDFVPGGGWSIYSAIHTQPQYRRLPWGDWEIRGFLAGGSIPGTILTLPVEARPRYATNLPCLCNAGSARIEINSAGAVSVQAGDDNAFLSLDGVRWSTQ